jgi:transposase
MTFSLDLRWRAIVLVYVYDVELALVGTLLGISDRSLTRWYQRFLLTGNVDKKPPAEKSSKWPEPIRKFVSSYIESHPCFYFEELRAAILVEYPTGVCLSDATICRALRFDLGLTRKVLTKRAAESLPRERKEFLSPLSPFYGGPDQLVFIDETSKDGR